MKLKLDIDPDIVAMMAAEVAAGERAVSAAIREAGTGLKAAWRLQITGAGLGARLARTIRSEQFPKATPSLNAAAVVWSNAPVIVGAHDTGPLIRSKNGFWLAIPTPAAGKSLRGGRITPGEWERRTGLRLRFIYRRLGPSLLVAEGRLNRKGRAVASRSKTGRGLVTAPIFLLVPQVKLLKRLDLARDAEQAINGMPGRIVAGFRNRRFVIGRGLAPTPGMKHFPASALGLSGDLDVLIPNSINRMRVKGAGSRFVHGGASLQEVVIPVIRVGKQREADVGQVEVQIFVTGKSLISSGQIAVTLYQAQPVSEKMRARELLVGIYALDGALISDEYPLTFDFRSDNAREREMPRKFLLSREADRFNNQDVVLKLRERVGKTSHYQDYATHRFQLRRGMTTDFDF